MPLELTQPELVLAATLVLCPQVLKERGYAGQPFTVKDDTSAAVLTGMQQSLVQQNLVSVASYSPFGGITGFSVPSQPQYAFTLGEGLLKEQLNLLTMLLNHYALFLRQPEYVGSYLMLRNKVNQAAGALK
jgi:hypothetical protein